MTDLHDAAIDYARRGWPVFPLYTWRDGRCSCGADDCSSPAKHPHRDLARNGLKNATTDIDRVHDWWTRFPHNNIGLRTDDVFDVLDIDGEEGRANLAALVEEHDLLPSGLYAATGGGGDHLFFAPTGITNRARVLPKIDWRGAGGYIVAPPSRHKSGRLYEWVEGPDGDIPPTPDWLLAILNPPKPERRERPQGHEDRVRYLAVPGQGTRYGIAALEGELDELAKAVEGSRNHELNAHAFNLFQLVGGGELDEAFVEQRLEQVASAIGLGGHEIAQTIRSARSAGMAQPRYAPELPARVQLAGTGTEGRPIPNEEPEPAPVVDATDDTPTPPVTGLFLDWTTFWARDRRDAEWLYEDVLARGRGHSIFAGHKSGKSLLTLYLATQLVTTLLADGVIVIYLDYEMGEDDLYDRLTEMGYGPNSDFDRLKYALLPSIPPLDHPEGAKALFGIVDHVQSDYPDHHIAVVIDTMGRAVIGEENSADTYRSFYRWTGLGLKQRGVTWARLDHAGKDATKGQRGSSGKGDDVDIVWKLNRTDNGIELKREAARMGWVPERVVFHRRNDPYLRFTKVDADWPAGTKEAARILDELGVPLGAGERPAGQAYRNAGHTAQQNVIRAALKWRRQSAEEGMK